MYKLSDEYKGNENIEELIEESISSGKAYDVFEKFVASQGGDLKLLHASHNHTDDPITNGFAVAPHLKKITVRDVLSFEADSAGTAQKPEDTQNDAPSYIITGIDAGIVGNVSMILGAGRIKKSDRLDNLAGVVFEKKCNDIVGPDDVIATLYSSNKKKLIDATDDFITSVTLEKGNVKRDYKDPVIKKLF